MPSAVYRFMEKGVKPKGFKTHGDLLKHLPQTKNHSWHHIVQQHDANIAKFGPEAIHNPCNVIQLPNGIHEDITKIQSEIRFDITGSKTLRVKDWIAKKSYEKQHEFGVKLFSNVLDGTWVPKK